MIPVTTRKGQQIALFGLGGSGFVTAKALVAGGASVIAYDDNPKSVALAEEQGIKTADLRSLSFSQFDALVLAPGVPLTHPQPHWTAKLANEAGVSILGDVALFAEVRREVAPESLFIAITGTNGKSTTTALISHVLKSAGKDVQMGGNIGKAVLSLEPPKAGRVYVVECSSYQIDLAPDIDPDIGVLLNLAPDHLDRHGTMENYASIKEILVSNAKEAVVGSDDPFTNDITKRLTAGAHKVTSVSGWRNTDVSFGFSDGVILDEKGTQLADLSAIPTLQGQHNAQNSSAAFAVCRLAGLKDSDIVSGLAGFPGLAHRMEIVGNRGETIFVNDSKATNSDAAAMALASYDRVYWIAGGLAKEGGIDGLKPLFDRIVKAYLIGEAAPEFAATLGEKVKFEIAETMEHAVNHAANDTAGEQGKAVVLLSPACASFDQYPNFEVRGEAFREAVSKLNGFVKFGAPA